MSKRTLGPFPQLQGLSDLDIGTATDEEILERMELLRETLEAAGCKCNGDHHGSPRDSDWGADISELVNRTSPHEIFDLDGTPETVRVKLGTLKVDIDDNNEISSWTYEESAP